MSTMDISPSLRRHLDSTNLDNEGGTEPGMLSSVVVYTLVGSILGFQLYNSALNFVPHPSKYEDKNLHKWRNIMTSFVHSFMSGCSSVYCIYGSPEILDDLIHNYDVRCEVLVALSTGYFAYDFFDIIKYKNISDTWQLMLHHVVIFCTFGISMYSKHYLGYALFSLMAEINSIFLHARQLMLMYEVSKSSFGFRLNSFVNLATFMLFRFGVLLWMAWWLSANHQLIPTTLVVVASVGLFIMLIGNVVMFYKLIFSDFVGRRGLEKKDIVDKNQNKNQTSRLR